MQAHITGLPQEVLATPLGQMLAPMLSPLEQQLGNIQQQPAGEPAAPSAQTTSTSAGAARPAPGSAATGQVCTAQCKEPASQPLQVMQHIMVCLQYPSGFVAPASAERNGNIHMHGVPRGFLRGFVGYLAGVMTVGIVRHKPAHSLPARVANNAATCIGSFQMSRLCNDLQCSAICRYQLDCHPGHQLPQQLQKQLLSEQLQYQLLLLAAAPLPLLLLVLL